MHPVDRKYAKSHEWIKVEGNKALVGISSFAQEHLGDVVFVELPAVGRKLAKGEAFGVVESVKSVSDIYVPAGGIVTRVNDRLNAEPGLINADAMGDGWIVEIELANPADLNDLLDAAAYEKHLEEEGGH